MNTTPTTKISGEAHKAYAASVRRWSGMPKASLIFDEIEGGVAPAMFLRSKQQFTANPDVLVLNPNRLVQRVTPFRMRQEAVLTGALLHEAGHARHSRWRKEGMGHGQAAGGDLVAEPTMRLARLLEEPRIEGLVAANQVEYGAAGLAWTMRATSAYLLPMTQVSTDPDQAIMDVLTSWTLRAGRLVALHLSGSMSAIPAWVREFNRLLVEALADHCEVTNGEEPHRAALLANKVMSLLQTAVSGYDTEPRWRTGFEQHGDTDTGTFMVDTAKEILDILYPTTPEDERPNAGGGSCGETGEGQSPAEQGEEGDQSDDQGEGGSEAGEDAAEGSEGGDALAEALSKMEDQAGEAEGKASKAALTESMTEATEAEAQANGGLMGGAGGPAGGAGGWRNPRPDERDFKRGAEKFLRDLVDPSEKPVVTLSDQPSATVDGAALAAWKAGGQVADPRFFRRTRREAQPTPPVKIAVLVDISSSMSVLQKPSALLSWAMAAACLDLRNFAGRGTQVESTLIHWGSDSRVVQANGQPLPGIREVPCNQGTTDMHTALALVEQQIPGFFTAGDKPENRLLVQFTDWQLMRGSEHDALPIVNEGLASGMNMLTVAPPHWRTNWCYQGVVPGPGHSVVTVYDPANPTAVWDHAASILG